MGVDAPSEVIEPSLYSGEPFIHLGEPFIHLGESIIHAIEAQLDMGEPRVHRGEEGIEPGIAPRALSVDAAMDHVDPGAQVEERSE
jgi:hypothetical protein